MTTQGTVSRSYVERMKMEDSFVLELVTGQDSAGRDCHQVLLMPAARVDALRRDLATRSVVLEEYGEVLAQGEGHTPPAGLVEELRGLVSKK